MATDQLVSYWVKINIQDVCKTAILLQTILVLITNTCKPCARCQESFLSQCFFSFRFFLFFFSYWFIFFYLHKWHISDFPSRYSYLGSRHFLEIWEDFLDFASIKLENTGAMINSTCFVIMFIAVGTCLGTASEMVHFIHYLHGYLSLAWTKQCILIYV